MTAAALRALVEDGRLDPALRDAAFRQMLRGEAEPHAVAGLLAALRLARETPDDLCALAEIAREGMLPFDARGLAVLDTCGTGGDGSGSFNISTAAALLAAAAGQPTVKHGNRSFSSSSGSADVLEALGVAADVEPARMEEALAATGFAFCFSPRHHHAMRHVAGVRRALKIRTLFNLLGPLVNPARAAFQVIGVPRPELAPLMAEAARRLGTRRAVVLHSEDGMDEVSLRARTRVWIAEAGAIREERWLPEQMGLRSSPAGPPLAAGPRESAAAIEALLSDPAHPGAPWALANAGAGLWCAERAHTLKDGTEMARAAIASGAALRLLQELRRRCPYVRN